jgi:hypothetical protein
MSYTSPLLKAHIERTKFSVNILNLVNGVKFLCHFTLRLQNFSFSNRMFAQHIFWSKRSGPSVLNFAQNKLKPRGLARETADPQLCRR